VQILAWLLVGLFLGCFVALSARREIQRLRSIGHTYGENHFASTWWAIFVCCLICAAFFSCVAVHTETFEDQVIVALLVIGGLWFAIVDLDTHVIPFHAVVKFSAATCALFAVTVRGDTNTLKTSVRRCNHHVGDALSCAHVCRVETWVAAMFLLAQAWVCT
jgi:hypothetical protein